MPSVEEELFLADTQQASHQRIKCLKEEHSTFRALISYYIQHSHNDCNDCFDLHPANKLFQDYATVSIK